MTSNASAGIPLLHAWDLGGNWGHVVPFLDLRQSLVDAGFHIYSAVSRVAEYGKMLAKHGVVVLQAPASCSDRPDAPSLAHRYVALGWGNFSTLLGQVEAWRNLITLTGARLLLADATLPGLIAARTLGVPAVNLSLAYHIPPAARPFFYLYPPSESEVSPSLLEVAAGLDHAMRQVFAYYRMAAPRQFVDLFAIEEPGFFCFPEMDHFGERPSHHYWGPLIGTSVGEVLDWPDVPGPKVFAYLRPRRPESVEAIRALAELGWPTVVACPGTPDSILGTLNPNISSLRMTSCLVDIGHAARVADLAVNHAGAGLTNAFLLAGKPLAMLPDGLESKLIADRVVAMGAGVILSESGPGSPSYTATLRSLAESKTASAAARHFAVAHADHRQDDLTRKVAARCRELTTKKNDG